MRRKFHLIQMYQSYPMIFSPVGKKSFFERGGVKMTTEHTRKMIRDWFSKAVPGDVLRLGNKQSLLCSSKIECFSDGMPSI
jgi:hypothetical protein